MDPRKYLPKAQLIDRKKFLLDISRGRSVMHVGCAGGLLDEHSVRAYDGLFSKENNFHARLSIVTETLAGLDISKEKIESMQKHGVEGTFYVGDITSLELEVQGTYDIVLFADIIEHLDDVKTALKNCARMMDREAQLVITTCNAFDSKTLIKLLLNYESVHLEHTAYYSYHTLNRVLTMNGFEMLEFYYADEKRKQFVGMIDRLAYYAGKIFSVCFPQYSQHIIAVARLT